MLGWWRTLGYARQDAWIRSSRDLDLVLWWANLTKLGRHGSQERWMGKDYGFDFLDAGINAHTWVCSRGRLDVWFARSGFWVFVWNWHVLRHQVIHEIYAYYVHLNMRYDEWYVWTCMNNDGMAVVVLTCIVIWFRVRKWLPKYSWLGMYEISEIKFI